MWEREIWRGLAVFDRGLEPSGQGSDNNSTVANTQSSTGFAVDESKDEPGEDDDDEELVLSAFDALDASEIFRHGETSNIQHAMIPTDNFLTLVMFLLLIAPLSNEESVSTYFKDLDADKLQDVRNHAYSILTSFGVERHPGISFKTFRKVMTTTLPHLLDSIRPFFEHFFYSKDFDLHKRQGAPAAPIEEVEPQNKSTTLLRPIIPSPTGELLTPATLSHLSFIVPPAILMRNLTLLYTGAEDGFSLPTFQNSVFNWSSPTILLISGSILSEHPASGQARSFMSGLPYRRFKSSAMPSQTVVYGAYIPEKWKQTHKSGFGTKETVLFQIYPQHDVFPGSSTATSYIYFNRYPSTYTGLGLGSYLAEQNNASAARGQTMIRRRSSVDDKIPLGPVSLHMDDSLTYAAFTHDSRGGGAFEPSKLPPSCRLTPSEESNSSMNANRSSVSSPVTSPPLSPLFKTSSPSPTAAPLAAPLTDWQDVFEIEQLEVYGLGGQEVAEEQRRARLWEEREAERRRAVTMKTGDLDADRELLKSSSPK